MNLWLDDKRPAPDGWTWVSTVDAAIEWLRTGDVKVVVWKWLVDGCTYLADASAGAGRFLDFPPPPKKFEMPDRDIDWSAWPKWIR